MKRNNRNKCAPRKQFALTWHGTISSVITKTIMDGDRKHSVINFPLPLAEWKINYYLIHNITGQYVTHSICVKNIFACRHRSTYAMPKHARARRHTHTHTHTQHTHTHTHSLTHLHSNARALLCPWTKSVDMDSRTDCWHFSVFYNWLFILVYKKSQSNPLLNRSKIHIECNPS